MAHDDHNDVENPTECDDPKETAQEVAQVSAQEDVQEDAQALQELQKLVEQVKKASKATYNRIQEAEMYFRFVLNSDETLEIEPKEFMATLIRLVFNLHETLDEYSQRIAEGSDPYLVVRAAHIQVVRFAEEIMPGTIFQKLDMDYHQAPPPECELVFMRQAVVLLIEDLDRIVNHG